MATSEGAGKLSVALTPDDTNLVLDAGNDPLVAGQTARIEQEQVVIQNVTGANTATISRGANGTGATSHPVGASVTLGVPASRATPDPNARPQPAMGTHLQIESSTTPGTYISVALVGPLAGPSLSRDTIDVTNQDNQSGYKEFIGSLKDGGEVTLTLFWNTNAVGQFQPDGLYAAFEDGLEHNFQIVLPAADFSWKFAGVVSKMAWKYDPNAAQTCDTTIKVSGKPTLAAYVPGP